MTDFERTRATLSPSQARANRARRIAVENDPETVSREKWGEALDAGFQVLPDTLLKHQGALDLTPTDLVVAINLTMQWWTLESLPFPTTVTIARRMGTSPRTVQRSLLRLEELGLVKRVRRRGQRTAFDLTPLAARLKRLARHDPAFRPRSRALNGDAGVQTRSPA